MMKKNILFSSLVFVFAFSWILNAGYPGQMGNFDPSTMQEPTPEEMRAIEAQINQEIENAIQQMSPEERKVFDETVQRLETMPKEKLERFLSGQMSPEEQESFVKEALPEEALKDLPGYQPAQPQENVAQQPIEIETAPVKQPVKQVDTGKQQAVIGLLNSITQRTGSFLSKVNELYGESGLNVKITTWKRRKKLQNFESYTSWSAVKKDIAQFTQKLHSLQDRDPKTRAYKYLDAIVADEGILNNLRSLQHVLESQEPIIEISPFGVGKTTSKSKEAIRHILNKYAEILKVVDLSKGIDTAIATYDPRAKALTEQAAKEQQTAAAAQRPVQQEYVTVGGRERAHERPSYGEPSYQPYGGGYSGGHTPNYGGSSYQEPSYRPSSSPERSGGGKTGTTVPSGSKKSDKEGSKGTKSKENEEKEEEETTPGKGGGKKTEAQGTKATGTKRELKKKEDRLVDDIEYAFADAASALKKTSRVYCFWQISYAPRCSKSQNRKSY